MSKSKDHFIREREKEVADSELIDDTDYEYQDWLSKQHLINKSKEQENGNEKVTSNKRKVQ